MLKDYWQQKSSRDKMLIKSGFGVVIVILLFTGIWLPIHTKRNDLQDQVNEQQHILALITKQVPFLMQLRATRPIPGSNDVFGLIEIRIKKLSIMDNKLTIVKLPDNKASIQFNEVSFDELIKQLVLLNKEYHVSVDEFDATRLEKPGMVSGKVVIAGDKNA